MNAKESPVVIEDIVGGGFAVGNGDPSEPYVGLLRGIAVEDHLAQITMAESRGFDAGWQAGIAYVESSVNQRIADAVAAAERQVHRDYLIAKRHRRFENLCAFVIVAVMATVLYLITRS